MQSVALSSHFMRNGKLIKNFKSAAVQVDEGLILI